MTDLAPLRALLTKLLATHDDTQPFSDGVIPGAMTGIAVARRAQQLRPGLKVLLTSGYLGDAVQGLSHEFALIDKPYQRADLAAEVRKLLADGPTAPLRRSTAG